MGPQIPAPPPTAPPPPGGGGPNTRLIAIVAGAVVVVAAVVVAVFVMGGGDEPGPGPSPTASGSAASPSPSASESPVPLEPTIVTNTSSIAFADEAASSLYPSVIEVAGFEGTVGDVSVTLHGLSHQFPEDVDVLVVGPGGQAVGLMSDVGGSNEAIDLEITFDDEASGILSDEGPLASGIVVPSSGVEGAGTCCGFQGVAPAPAPPYESALSVFDGTDPNGEWSLYVYDDAAGDTGTLSGGWSLRIAPPGAPEPTLTGPTGATGATGSVAFQDDFSDPSSGWGVFDDADAAAGYADGSYVIETREPRGVTGYVRDDFADLGDARVTVTTAVQTDVPLLYYGVVCRTTEDGAYYGAFLTTDGFYQFIRNDGTGLEFLRGALVESINRGAAVNQMELTCVGGTDGDEISLTLIVNGEAVSEYSEFVDPSLSGTGGFGFLVVSDESVPATVAFDDLIVQGI